MGSASRAAHNDLVWGAARVVCRGYRWHCFVHGWILVFRPCSARPRGCHGPSAFTPYRSTGLRDPREHRPDRAGGLSCCTLQGASQPLVGGTCRFRGLEPPVWEHLKADLNMYSYCSRRFCAIIISLRAFSSDRTLHRHLTASNSRAVSKQ